MPSPAAAAPRLEQVVLVVRHGVRAPLPGEVAAAAYADAPWPQWDTPPSQLTAHGREAVRLSGDWLRRWLSGQGVLPVQGCPAPGSVAVRANTDQRTIDSGLILAQALAPGCGLVAEHRPEGTHDPLFRPVEAGAVDFDARAAVASILRENGGPAALVAAHRPELEAMREILGCTRTPCDFAAMPSSLVPGEDGRGFALKGPVDLTSGTGEVLLLQYAQGMPLDQVGWGRATSERLEQVSRLHALLFDIYARPRYMAVRSGGPLAGELLRRLGDAGSPRVSLFVGSDNHIAALSSLLGVHFHLPGYGADDPPPGGALMVGLWRDPASGERSVRVEYLAQSLQQLRTLQPLDLEHPPLRQALSPSICTDAATPDGCPLDAFVRGLRASARPSCGKDAPADADCPQWRRD
ncbi:histidine-type phosphatase [Stenotrophomonas sp. MMGLT7]|uniref:histidine-type phosphatase n=1 Tax=Stenotrophomonas sp. MMGLT7 TaxID=2901227 RepID=UPI001E28363F|nr:histidine-type phosphatase [Stenotrophomonas sp. MMGLT7]